MLAETLKRRCDFESEKETSLHKVRGKGDPLKVIRTQNTVDNGS